MNSLTLFLPCAAGVESYLEAEVRGILDDAPRRMSAQRGGLLVEASWREMMQLNLNARLCQRVLIQLKEERYQSEDDIYQAASSVPWEMWFSEKLTFKVDITAQYSPLKSLNFAALRVKDAVADRFREWRGARPDVDVKWPQVRVYVHLTQDTVLLFVDTSGEPLFKRGWRTEKGEAPLKETLAAAMIAASGWADTDLPLYDPCCGSGTIAIEAAQIECRIAPGHNRRFGFEHLNMHQAHVWQALKAQAKALERAPTRRIYGSDVSFRMVDFAQNNAERAGVAHAIEFRGGDALQRNPPTEGAGMLILNPPYDERIAIAGVAARSQAQMPEGGDFFLQLASHWKKNFSGWTAWILTPNLKLPTQMRLKESRRVPMWNGPIECRFFKFEMVAGSARQKPKDQSRASSPDAELERLAFESKEDNESALVQRVVIDTNVILDLCLFEDPKVDALKLKIQDKSLIWLATQGMRDELVRVLTYPHLLGKAQQKDESLQQVHGTTMAQLLKMFDEWVTLCETAPKARYMCKDPDDQKFIDLAAHTGALLISKDKAVLALTNRLARLGVKVCNTHKLQF